MRTQTQYCACIRLLRLVGWLTKVCKEYIKNFLCSPPKKTWLPVYRSEISISLTVTSSVTVVLTQWSNETTLQRQRHERLHSDSDRHAVCRKKTDGEGNL